MKAMTKSPSTHELDDAIMKDFMVKRSQQKKYFNVDNLKDRWFLLKPKFVAYYDGDLVSGPKREKGRIFLYNVRAIEEVDPEAIGGRTNAFQIVYQGDVNSGEIFILYIFAVHSEQRDKWIEALRDACLECEVKFAKKYHPGVWQGKTGRYTCCDTISRSMVGCQKSTYIPPTPPEQNGFTVPDHGQNQNRPLPDPPDIATTPEVPVREDLDTELKRVLALHDFQNAELEDLPLTKGEEYTILNDTMPHWWFAKDKHGNTGYIPANYVELVTDDGLEKYDWYYKNCTREKSAEILLKENKDGCFLVRDSSVQGMYTLSLCTKESGHPSVKHYHIKKTSPDHKFYIAENYDFETIPDLIFYHKHNSAGLIVRLRSPPSDRSSIQPTTAGFGHDMFEIDPSELDYLEELGSGQFGKVTRAKWRHQQDVAVKQMLSERMSEDDFIEEARTMLQLQHPNLVQLYGVCTQQGPICLIAEFMKHGSLLDYLTRRKFETRLETKLDICVQVCDGMHYLVAKGFIHRDLAARNCLVGDNLVIKVGDFGLARFVLDDEYRSSKGTRFPVRWAPPEVLKHSFFSSKSDVWAFGVLVWEVYTGGDMPYGQLGNQLVVDIVCNRNQRLEQPPSCSTQIYQVMMSCWHKTPELRANFGDLYTNLKTLQEGYNSSGYEI